MQKIESANGNGGLTCTRFDDIALIWLRGRADLNHVGVLSLEDAESTLTRDLREPPRFHHVRLIFLALRQV